MYFTWKQELDDTGKMIQEIRWLPSSKHDCTGSHHTGSCWDDSSSCWWLPRSTLCPEGLTLYKFGMVPTATGVCSHLHKWERSAEYHIHVLFRWGFKCPTCLSYMCLTTPTRNFVHHTLDLLYLKLSLDISEKASQSALGWESCLDPNSSTRPLCGFTPLMYSRCSVFGFSSVSPSSSASSWAHSGLGSMSNHSEWKPLQHVWIHLSGMSHQIYSLHVSVNMR